MVSALVITAMVGAIPESFSLANGPGKESITMQIKINIWANGAMIYEREKVN